MNNLSFAISKFNLMDVSNSELMKVRLWIVSEGDNQHKKPISWDCIEKSRPTLIGKPIVAKYDRYSKDLMGHEFDEIAVGVVLSDNDIFYETDEDGKRWLCADGIIWCRYAKDISFVLDRDQIKNLSMEIIVLESGENDSIESFCFSGITLISTTPAISNARAEVLSFSKVKEEIEHLMFDFKIPSIVKQNAERGISLKQNNPKDATAVNISIANQLINNEFASLDLLHNIIKFSAKTKTETAQYLLGGFESLEWAENAISPQIEEIKKEEDIVIIEAMEKFSLNSSQIRDILSNALSEYKYKNGNYEYTKYWVNCYDDVYVYVEDNEDYTKTYRMTYNIVDNVATVDVDSAEDVIRGNFIPVNSKEEVNEEIGMSSDQNTEAVAQAELADKQAETDKELAEENKEEMSKEETMEEVVPKEDEENFQTKFVDMFTKYEEMLNKYSALETQMSEITVKMSTSEDQMVIYMAENEQLKKFKSDIEKKEMMSVIEYTLSEVMESMPKEQMEELREDAKNFSSDNLNIWVNKVKAEAFSFSKGKVNNDGFMKVGLPFANENNIKESNSLWDRI